MKKMLAGLVAISFFATVHAEKLPQVDNPRGFIILPKIFFEQKQDLYKEWEESNLKLKGSVYKFLDWENVSKITVIYNFWHIPAAKDDIRLKHIEANLKNANFGDKFKGSNLGGIYIFLLQYRNDDRNVLLAFYDGLFIIESNGYIGMVDIRK